MDELTGALYEVVYRNEQNGYSVVDIDCDGVLNTVVGYFAYINQGEMIRAFGSFVNHSDYGRQFKMESYTVVSPNTIWGIEKYLASGLIHGIGPSTAKKLVEKFGIDTLDIIQYNPEKLTEIEGIGKKKAESIHEAFSQQKELRDIMVFLEQYGISPSYAVRIYKTYGVNTIKEIKENPYKLADDVFGIGFKLADKIAMTMGVSDSSEFRLSSGIKYIINQYHGLGHTYIHKELLIEKACEILSVQRELIENALVSLFINKGIVVEKFDDIEAVYSVSFFRAESSVARRLIELSSYKVEELTIELNESDIKLAALQQKAVLTALKNGIVIITGGPGTGKTTTIKTLIKIFEKAGKSVLLAAPTGRAAKRMQEATGTDAKTIHRLLEYGAAESDTELFFQKNEDSPLEADVVIIDEVSMVDILLMNSLLRAIAHGTRLILVGDADQLPSVGPGNVLRDIIDSGVLPVVRLDEIFRQARESLIVVNAHKVNSGEMPIINSKDRDFFFIKKEGQLDIANTVVELCKKRLPAFTGYDFLDGIQVLSPMKKGDCGVVNLNTMLQRSLNPPSPDKKEKLHRDTIFRVGDKIMQIKNNYKQKWTLIDNENYEGEGVFNGDIGVIKDIDFENQYVCVVYDSERLCKYEFSSLDELELSYALTVHKSQGSEFPVVVMPITFGAPMLLTRNLLYTALTRAKKLVVLVGNERFLYQMVMNNHITMRYSGLLLRLQKMRG